MNWRKSVVFDVGIKIFKPDIHDRYSNILEYEKLDRKGIETLQSDKLKELLEYAYSHTTYYRKLLQPIFNEGEITSVDLNKIPILTKDIIRKNFNDMKSDQLSSIDHYVNTSGGSTGVPVKFIQTKKYWDYAVATKIYYAYMAGKEFGEPEVKFWGSERDIQTGSIGLKNKIINWLYNRKFMNSFKLSNETMENYLKQWNSFKPKYVWTYVDSIYHFAKFIERHGFEIYSPEVIVSTAGPLYEDIRKFVEEVFNTKVINQYGSREVGDIGSECIHQNGLHIFEYSHIVELLDENLNPVSPGEMGDVYVTLLTNYAFPLIRYKLGDTAVWSKRPNCKCGRNFKRIETVKGRISDHFLNQEGELIHGEYFTHIFYNLDWVDKFQVVQEDISTIRVKIVKVKEPGKGDISKIKKDILKVMHQCEIIFDYRDSIEKSPSGKYRYVYSKV